MNLQRARRTVKRLSDSPKEILENARKGSLPDLRDLANFWQEVPEFVSLGILDVFFHHLNADKAFVVPSPANDSSPLAEYAFAALLGLTKVVTCLHPAGSHYRHPSIRKAWPGVFKWSAFFFKTRVTSTPPMPIQGRRTAMDVIASAWYGFIQAEGMREVMSTTMGSVEIATQLWLLDDEVPSSGPQFIVMPAVAGTLDNLLAHPTAPERAVAAGGGNTELIVKLAMSRTRKALARSPIDAPAIAMYVSVMNRLVLDRDRPLRHAFLQAGAIQLCTKVAGTLARTLNAGGNLEFIDGIVSALGFLGNCLESTEGFTWVTQSLNADLLVAWADFSPHFSRLDEEDYELVSSLLTRTLTTYLVYRSVVQAVDNGMQRLGQEQLQRIGSSKAKKAWMDFRKLAEERVFVLVHASAIKNKAAACDNVECHKIDAKNAFSKCGGCSTTLYCSKECQTIAWKTGGHKAMCKMKQRERLEGKSQAISKADIAFLHVLTARDARHHLPLLRRLARTQYPALRSGELVIRIDYTVVPPAYTVIPLADAGRIELSSAASANAEARTDATLERARENPDRYAIVQSTIVNGAQLQLVVSVMSGGFWEGDEGGAVADSEGLETGIDNVDLMMGRTALNRFLVQAGEKPAY
ncbi:hypothetical protein C8R46DRAFT_1001507 [Mycena filopes]|nr:hypothetical protein C8R46DRAFT_1001507 [Mycena filopes]